MQPLLAYTLHAESGWTRTLRKKVADRMSANRHKVANSSPPIFEVPGQMLAKAFLCKAIIDGDAFNRA